MEISKPLHPFVRSGDVMVGVGETARVIDATEAAQFCYGMWPRLVGALSLAYNDADLAEELAQEALSRVYERWSHIRTLEDPEAYTFRIGFNLARSWWRRRAAEVRAHGRLAPQPASHNLDPAGALAVRQAITSLSPRQREAIVHRYFLGRTVKEAATAMKCREGTVRALTSQAIAALRASGLGVDDE
jgi:RNA polymerase sigma factor (sigma-70 family)